MNDKLIVKIVFALLIVFNLKYLFFLLQVPYTFFFGNFREKTMYSTIITPLKKNKYIFEDKTAVGFVSDVETFYVMDMPGSVKNFYSAQYAIVPSILQNSVNKECVIGVFDKPTDVDKSLKTYKILSPSVYIFKRSKEQ